MNTGAQPVPDFIRHVETSLADNTFAGLILSGGTDAAAPRRVMARWVRIKDGPRLSVTGKQGAQAMTRSLRADEVRPWLERQMAGAFRGALLRTTVRDWQLSLPPGKAPWLISHKPATKDVPSRAHDEAKPTWLDASARDWLFGLDVCDERGRVNPGMADKHRQIHRYLEIFAHLAKDCGWAPERAKEVVEARTARRVWMEGGEEGDGGSATAPVQAESQSSGSVAGRPPVGLPARFTIADMGCGKGYLTFAVWHLLCRRWRLPARIIGVERRPALVRHLAELAAKLDAPGLEFVAGEIATASLPRVDALIALHACDTATDDAVRRGIASGAKLIVVAPCCQQQVRPQLGRPEPLAPVLEHGIMAGRMAEWVTDGLRALFLEWAGYRAKLVEFVGGEHTPKNLMLAGVREREPFTSGPARQRILDLKRFFGISQHALDGLLESGDSGA